MRKRRQFTGLTALGTPLFVRFGKEARTMKRVLMARARAHKRSVSEELKYYAYLGMAAEANPDLLLDFIKCVLEAREESEAGLSEPYQWGILEADR